MNTISFRLLSACSVFLGGCCHPSQSSENLAPDKEPPPMTQIRNLSVTDATLTVDYRVSNPSKEDIWVCYDTWVQGNQNVQHAATRIEGETVWIELRFNLERGPSFVDPPPVGKYVRLPPGESYSGRIVRNLPIKDYSREWRADRKEQKDVMLHRAVFEIGYIRTFGPKWKKLLDSWSEKLKKEPIKPEPIVSGPFYLLPSEPLLTEETLDGRSREVIYLHYASFVEREESAEVFVPDVAIPCSVVIDHE